MSDPDHIQLINTIRTAIIAHQEHPKQPKDSLRFWDGKTPYAIHPVWCAITLLHETLLPDEIRLPGYQTLLLHDILEDTTLPLPADLDPLVVAWVQAMTYESFTAEQEAIWNQPDEIKLLKLYDKTSILLDAVWMKPEKWNHMVRYTLSLADFAEQTYGALNIVKIARALAVEKPV